MVLFVTCEDADVDVGFGVCVCVDGDVCHLWSNDHHEEAKHEEEHDDLQGGDVAPHPFDAAHPLLFGLYWSVLFFCNKGVKVIFSFK